MINVHLLCLMMTFPAKFIFLSPFLKHIVPATLKTDLILKSASLLHIVIVTLGRDDALNIYLPLWKSTVDLG